MLRSTPFGRAIAIFAALAAVSRGSFTPEQFALANTPYRSRGKGLGRHSGKKWGGYPTDWLGRGTGIREAARRRRQIADGTLQVSA